MKKVAKWLAVISIVVFVIAWGIMGLKILDNDYLITAEAYIPYPLCMFRQAKFLNTKNSS